MKEVGYHWWSRFVVCEGSASISDIINDLDGEVRKLKNFRSEGYEACKPVHQGYTFLAQPGQSRTSATIKEE